MAHPRPHARAGALPRVRIALLEQNQESRDAQNMMEEFSLDELEALWDGLRAITANVRGTNQATALYGARRKLVQLLYDARVRDGSKLPHDAQSQNPPA